MKDIKLVAFDLDGTLLTFDKRITKRTYDTLEAASKKGVAIVPATGRFMRTVPQEIKDMPFVDYVISINGAYVLNVKTGEAIYRSEIPQQRALDILSYFDTLPIAYDCYMDNDSFINKEMMDHINDYVEDQFYLDLVWKFRKPVKELKAHIKEAGKDIQKLMAYTKDQDVRHMLMGTLQSRFPGIIVTSSIKNNIEINASGANKGDAIKALAESIGIDISQTMAFGDSFNDIPMIKAAGVGVCMANGNDETKAEADMVAPSCDEDGVAAIIEEYVLAH